MSAKKLGFMFAMAATVALGACSWQETITATETTQTRLVNDGSVASSGELDRDTGASGGFGATGTTGGTVTRTYERSGFGEEYRQVR